ncbi:MAG: hypothetical protein LLG15_10025 [Betaproteobacteria bacterium]|nr:hypothetical protein [Betaproteobacteria bacterium]
MKRISIVLKTSEVTVVRKAVFAAGGSRIMISPASSRNAVELTDWNCGMSVSAQDAQVRFDVTVDNEVSDGVISAILASARVGKIETITLLPAKTSRASIPALRRAA